MRDDPKDRSRVAHEWRGHLALDPLDIGEPVAAVDLAIGQIDEGGAVIGEAFHRPREAGMPSDGLERPSHPHDRPVVHVHVHIPPKHDCPPLGSMPWRDVHDRDRNRASRYDELHGSIAAGESIYGVPVRGERVHDADGRIAGDSAPRGAEGVAPQE